MPCSYTTPPIEFVSSGVRPGIFGVSRRQTLQLAATSTSLTEITVSKTARPDTAQDQGRERRRREMALFGFVRGAVMKLLIDKCGWLTVPAKASA